MVYRFMSEHRDEYAVREMAGIFGVSRGAWYRWAKKGGAGGGRKPIRNWQT
jgi:transposase